MEKKNFFIRFKIKKIKINSYLLRKLIKNYFYFTLNFYIFFLIKKKNILSKRKAKKKKKRKTTKELKKNKMESGNKINEEFTIFAKTINEKLIVIIDNVLG